MDQDKFNSESKLVTGIDTARDDNRSPIRIGQGFSIANVVDKTMDNTKPNAAMILGLDGGKKKVAPGDQIERELDDIEDDLSDDDSSKKLEDVRMSNFAYSQTKISEYISFYFAMLGVGCQIIASEIYFFNNFQDKNKEHIIIMYSISNVTSLFLILSTIAGYLLYVRWKRTKRHFTKADNIINTGLYKPLIFECLLTLLMGYPSQYGETYVEKENDFTTTSVFITNDILLCIMIFARTHYLVRCILQISFYTDPRSQRICAIYGTDATNMYAVKAIMVNNSWIIVIFSTFISLIMFSVQLRLFERVVQPNFFHITTSMWNILITMTTVGYGDVYAMSHTGRFIAVIAAFWGIFLLSLFILSLMNMLNLDSSEQKAYNLLQRLLSKDIMRKQAVHMLSAAFKIKKIREKEQNPKVAEINALQRFYQRSSDEFNKLRKNLRNSTDMNADMDSLKLAVDQVNKDLGLIRSCVPASYKHLLVNPKLLIKQPDEIKE
eukprot:403340011